MSRQFVPEATLAVGVDPHRDQLEIVAIKFPEVVLVDAAFDNTAAGQRTLLQRVRAAAAAEHLRPIFGLEDSGNYGYNLARYLVEEGCEVKEVNPVKTDRKSTRLNSSHYS